jgi:hypothetical protein
MINHPTPTTNATMEEKEQILRNDNRVPAAVDRYLERKRTSLKPNSFRETVRYLRDHSLPLHSVQLLPTSP